jgi:hypothetical protein
MKIFAFSGKAGCGKNYTIEQILIPWFANFNCAILAFGDLLKFLALNQHNDTLCNHISTSSTTKTTRFASECKECLDDIIIYKSPPIRNLLTTTGDQYLHTQMFGKYIDFMLETNKRRNIDIVFISDLRYQYEYNMLENYQYRNAKEDIVKFIRLDTSISSSANPLHSSECELDHVHFDFVMPIDVTTRNNNYRVLINWINEMLTFDFECHGESKSEDDTKEPILDNNIIGESESMIDELENQLKNTFV